MTEMGY